MYTYSDGALGAGMMQTAGSTCYKACLPYRSRVGRYRCMRACQNRTLKKASAGFGEVSSSTWIGLATAGALLAALIAMPVMGSRKKMRRNARRRRTYRKRR